MMRAAVRRLFRRGKHRLSRGGIPVALFVAINVYDRLDSTWRWVVPAPVETPNVAYREPDESPTVLLPTVGRWVRPVPSWQAVGVA